MKNKHLLKLLDLSREEIHEILDLADQLMWWAAGLPSMRRSCSAWQQTGIRSPTTPGLTPK